MAVVLAAAFLVAVVEDEACLEVRGDSEDVGSPSASEWRNGREGLDFDAVVAFPFGVALRDSGLGGPVGASRKELCSGKN